MTGQRPASGAQEASLRVLILGAAAGGGFPQWNCDCPGCRAARSGEALPSGQVSLALSANGEDWVIVNASPDILSQIRATPELHPRGLRQSPIRAVALTNGEIDAVAGLLSLREGTPFELWASARVQQTLTENSLFDVLKPGIVARKALHPETPFRPAAPDGRDLGLEILPFTVPGKPAWYLRDHALPDEGDTVALEIRAGGKKLFIFTACAEVTDPLRERLRGADLVFFDGTLWRDDEMIRAGLAQKTGASMGHLSISGPEGAIARLADLGIARKVFVHINNSNPVLRPASPERAETEAAGWEIGHEGARYTLCSN
ncbi:pyrroloquinoline quinone biosynthesis protein PqqB [Paenirhodobacter enshiensis]|uniref:pyrroloquinoline quinone biosynthesis protein PqqB n=1 Tax=Paenirhodobacter enshiensis TaxID=1105367 RepID=UPI003FA2F940